MLRHEHGLNAWTVDGRSDRSGACIAGALRMMARRCSHRLISQLQNPTRAILPPDPAGRIMPYTPFRWKLPLGMSWGTNTTVSSSRVAQVEK